MPKKHLMSKVNAPLDDSISSSPYLLILITEFLYLFQGIQ